MQPSSSHRRPPRFAARPVSFAMANLSLSSIAAVMIRQADETELSIGALQLQLPAN